MINDLNNVFANQKTIRNYKEMCSLLNEVVLEGNSRIAQHKEWERYFKYSKIGHKYIIEEVYDVPMPKEDVRSKGNNSVYIKYIETILLRLLSEQKDQTLLTTKKNLFCGLGMASKKYIDKSTRGLLVETHQFKQYEIDEFDAQSYKLLNRILVSALNNLKKRCLLDWFQELHISKKVNGKEKTLQATEDEVRTYTKLKRDVLDEMSGIVTLDDIDGDNIETEEITEPENKKYDSLQDVFLHNKMAEFYSKLEKKIKTECGWDKTFMYYRLIYTTSSVIKAIPTTDYQLKKLQSKEEIFNEKLLLNDKIIMALNKNFISHFNTLDNKYWNEYDQLCEENGYGTNASSYSLPLALDSPKATLPNKEYVDIQSKLASKLIKIKSKEIDNKIDQNMNI